MCAYFDYWILGILFLWLQTVKSMSLINKKSYFMDDSATNGDIADFVVSQGYLPNDKDLPKSTLLKNGDNDVTYLLSKLSDEELIKLLNDQPKKNIYDINDIVQVAVDSKSTNENKNHNLDQRKPREKSLKKHNDYNKKRFQTVAEGDKTQGAYFRLEDKQVDPYNVKNDADPNDIALQKINNLLYSRPSEDVGNRSEEEEEKKELLFDVLVAQLKTLCCKKSKTSKKRDKKKFQYKALLNDLVEQENSYNAYVPEHKTTQIKSDKMPNEYMFLIINDEIKSNGSDELISVDPESLHSNSNVLLLGPVASPLTDTQLKLVMNRISNELSKPDYLPLLHQLSEGTLTGDNLQLIKSLVSGPETRRYIKPHRCNHQSTLAKVYGGPKWIICTGYLNLNGPSLYD